ncbi:hypothetical protein GGR57DRAFT_464523, partial [Xylariaceae sp. FL1272]
MQSWALNLSSMSFSLFFPPFLHQEYVLLREQGGNRQQHAISNQLLRPVFKLHSCSMLLYLEAESISSFNIIKTEVNSDCMQFKSSSA